MIAVSYTHLDVYKRQGFELLEVISRKRGFLRSGGIVDPVQGAIMLLDEFRAGKLGYITLDRDIDL